MRGARIAANNKSIVLHSNTPTTQLVPILRESLVSVLNPAVGETIAHSRAQQQQRRKKNGLDINERLKI
jgi:hypothetical protein